MLGVNKKGSLPETSENLKEQDRTSTCMIVPCTRLLRVQVEHQLHTTERDESLRL